MLSPAETAKALSNASHHKANMPLMSIIMLAMMAGGAIAMGDIFWAHSTVGVAESIAPGIANLLGGIAFSTGLMMVVFFGGHLFTSSILSGVTTYEGKLPLSKTISYWTIVWIFNFVGAALIAYLYYKSGLPVSKYDGSILKHFITIGAAKTSLGFTEAFIRGIFCNVFVCMAIWTAIAAKDTAGKVLGIAFLIGAFVSSGYEHCVANMFIISEALIAKAHYLSLDGATLEHVAHLGDTTVEKLENLSVVGFIKNLIPVTLGNIVGGLIFVGIVGFASHKPDMK
ncbi:MAG TPA: formate/nitrite transporter family protein [Nautiliaceae bacterium]|nr:formate/nitrite transporter family protein [Nautiliaceae bacterium]